MSALIKYVLEAEALDEFSSEDLVKVLRAADDAYENGDEPLMSDAQYDYIKKYFASEYPKNDYLLAVGSDVRGGKIDLPNAMGSLTQVFTDDDLQGWLTKNGLGSDVSIVATHKLDGMSASLHFNNTGTLRVAYSRGNGYQGADITRHVKNIKSLPKQVLPDTEVRCELIISKANFEIVRKLAFRSDGSPYKNPRNMISGIMNSSEANPIVYDYIDCLVYHDWNEVDHMESKTKQLLHFLKMGFKVPEYVEFPAAQLNEWYLTELVLDCKKKSDYELDGIVFEINDVSQRLSTNPSKATLNPEYARKFKASDGSNSAIATVDFVEWRVSKRGYIKPRVHFIPFSLPGITVTHATGYNAMFIIRNGVGPGAKVRVERRGDVIPNIVGIVDPVKYDFVNDLDDIGEWKWSENDKGEKVDAVLLDGHGEAALKLTEAFFTGIGVDGLKLGNLRKLFSVNMDTPEKIIKASLDEMGFALGSQTTADKIHESLHKCLKQCKLPQFMGATGLFGRGVGKRKVQALYDVMGEDIVNIERISQIEAVEGFDTTTAHKIMTGLPLYRSFYDSVKDYVQFVKKTSSGTLSGQVFVFTGFRNKTLQTRIEDAGGEVLDSVSSRVTMVIAAEPDDSSSGKIKKAMKLKIRIIGLGDVETTLFS